MHALQDVAVRIERGEVHGLIGENGAGKTTLMRIAYGFYQPDAGQIFVDGALANLSSPREALKLGIGMVHQHSLLVKSMTITENIMLGVQRGFAGLPRRQTADKLSEIIEKHRLRLDPESQVSELGVAAQQRVEILRALYERAQVLILDEPTAVLTPQEAEALFEDFLHYRDLGTTIVLITHKLPEVMSITDRVTVLRRGRVIHEANTNDTSASELATAMVGRSVALRSPREGRGEGAERPLVLEIRGLTARGERNEPGVTNVNAELRKGEILGVAGIDGNGTTEFVECLAGLRPASNGSVILDGVEITDHDPAKRRQLGLRHIPEDRLDRGSNAGASVAENMILGRHRQYPIASGGILRMTAIRRFAAKLIEEFSIAAPDPSTLAAKLSGGNLQKVIIAREAEKGTKVLLAAQPTRGVDVGATAFIKEELVRLCEEGTAVVLVSAELSDLIDLSDRIAVFYEGRIAGLLEGVHMTEENIGRLMAGMTNA